MKESVRPTRGTARLGIVVPVSNTNLEPDMMMLAPAGVSLHFARAGGYDVDQIPDEKQMRQYSDTSADHVIDSLRLCRSDIVLYGCTSATLAQGPDYDRAFRESIEKIAGVPAVTAASALVAVLQALEVERFAFTSPYVATLNNLAVDFIEFFGMTCVSRVDAPEAMSNEGIGDTTPDEIVGLALEADCDSAQAIVIACTDYRATEAIDEIEACLGKPVITSNQATLLAGLSRLGIPLGDSGLTRHLAASCFTRIPEPDCREKSR
jgi:maleate cis-trans isomerase